MKSIFTFFVFYSAFTYSQNIDYNTKKGLFANGYDVVSYFNETPKPGDKAYISIFDGISFIFSSKENLNLFNKNPKKYIPQYGGYCAYAIGLKAKKVSINPETYKIEDGKLYLFYNAWGTNTLELWEKENSALLKEKANKNWEKIKFKKN